MAGLSPRGLSPPEVIDIHLLAFVNRVEDLGDDLGLLHQRGADLDAVGTADQKDAIELDFTGILVQVAQIDVKHVALTDAKLLAAVFDYCIHLRYSLLGRKPGIIADAADLVKVLRPFVSGRGGFAQTATLVAVRCGAYAARMRSGSPQHVGHGRKWDTSGVLLTESTAKGALDLPAVFGNSRCVEAEIGTGKGTFLLARAAARAELNFLGVEWAKAYCCYAADRVRRAGLSNVRMLRADAAHLFRTCLADRSLWRVHIHFPDPWPKRRHHRRRLIQSAFLADLRRVLAPGGQLLIVTDHIDYFRHIERVLACTAGLARTPFPKMADASGQIVGTNFEKKYIAQGRAFYVVACLRYA